MAFDPNENVALADLRIYPFKRYVQGDCLFSVNIWRKGSAKFFQVHPCGSLEELTNALVVFFESERKLLENKKRSSVSWTILPKLSRGIALAGQLPLSGGRDRGEFGKLTKGLIEYHERMVALTH